VSYKRTVYPSRVPGFTPVFLFIFHFFLGWVRVSDLFSFLCCVVPFCFVCLRPVSCVLNVVSVSSLPILDFPFGFL
jgi:hypothetical protein